MLRFEINNVCGRGLALNGSEVLTTISFPAFSGLLATFMAAAAAAPEEIPTCTIFTELKTTQDPQAHFKSNEFPDHSRKIACYQLTYLGRHF